jgi:predicted ATPase/DNA-binding NarL/FixJ family response regulator
MASTHLPIQLTSFIGREREIADVKELLCRSPLVTLCGSGGSGKTRLAIQVANEVSEAYPDGAWLIDLAPLREPGLVPQFVVEALGLRFVSSQPVLESLTNFLQPKQILLILDNCEHLRAACAEFAQQVLSRASNLRILATSREPLAISGERVFPLSGLAWPSSKRKIGRNSDLQDLIAYDAMRLFDERARAILPGFLITAENAMAIAVICQRLDGLPLAIELASARANILTVQEIATRLDNRFSLLTSGSHTAREPRHQTLRAAIDWSYALLTDEERIFLSRLAVFSAGCTLDMAEAIGSDTKIAEERALDLISSLVDKSFIIAETVGRTQARYRLLETIREYALEKLNELGEAARLRDCHLDLFLARVEDAAPKLNGAYQQLWLNWMEGEHDNLRTALTWAIESGRIEAGMRIAIAISRFWEIRGHVQEGLMWFERLFSKADGRISLLVHANALVYASFFAMFLGKASTSERYGREAAAMAEGAGDAGNPILILALSSLDSGSRAAGDFQGAFALGERAIKLLRATPGPSVYLGMTLLAQGDVAIELGSYATARTLLEESLALAREDDDSFRIAHAYNSFGDLARYQGNYAEAQTAYEKSVNLLRNLDARHDLASIKRNLGRACLLAGDVDCAITLFNESLAAHQAEQNKPGMIDCLIGLAATAVMRGLLRPGACLLAATIAIRGERAESVWPAKKMEVEPYLGLAKVRLTKVEFQTEQAAGRAMSLEQAISFALKLPFKSEIVPDPGEALDSLTGREREIAALIGLGKTNGEIASERVLSKRTVESHVNKILSKLGLANRGQIMRWAIEHGLTQSRV